jgi:predicted short-subunit dehydrogenase-like oxidoreductase (DUF2520 family)
MLESEPREVGWEMTRENEKRKRATTSRPRSRKLTVALIGAGRLGSALSLALRDVGHTVNIALARSSRSARRAGALLRTQGIAVGAKQLSQLRPHDRELIARSDLILITTRDDSIRKAAGELSAMSELQAAARRKPKPIALHTSGALTSEALNQLRQLGFATGSVHPLLSISGQVTQDRPFSGVHFSLEGDPAAIRSAGSLVRDLGGKSFLIDAQSKPLYHAAAVMASPHVTALIDIAIEMLSHCGIGLSSARRMLLPLIQSTIANLINQSPRQALTGTFKRGDIDTVRVHLGAIASQRLTNAMDAYATLGSRSLTMSAVPQSRQRAIEALMADAKGRYERTSIPTKSKPSASKTSGRN